MLRKILEQGDWVCWCNETQEALLAEVSSVENLIEHLEALPVTLKDNHRSTVKRGSLSDFGLQVDVVAKRPVDKNRRRWSRLSSLFLDSEAATTIKNLSRLQAAGVQSVSPLFALEKRVSGMVVDSWICYEYRSGEPCGHAELNEIIALLHQMHSAGFRHDDPTWNNFLLDDDGVLFTIDTKARPCKGAFHITHDFVLLKRDNDLNGLDIHSLGNLNKASFGYWLAMMYVMIKAARSSVKDKLKKNRPKNI